MVAQLGIIALVGVSLAFAFKIGLIQIDLTWAFIGVGMVAAILSGAWPIHSGPINLLIILAIPMLVSIASTVVGVACLRGFEHIPGNIQQHMDWLARVDRLPPQERTLGFMAACSFWFVGQVYAIIFAGQFAHSGLAFTLLAVAWLMEVLVTILVSWRVITATNGADHAGLAGMRARPTGNDTRKGAR